MTHSAGGSGDSEGRVDGGAWVTSRVGRTPYRTDVSARGFGFTTDEPYALGGTDAGPTPYEYLLGALGGCTAITLRMYADRKGWPLEGVEVSLRTARSHEKDCEECEKSAVGITRLERKIDLRGPLDDEQRRRLMQMADRCPVKQTMERGLQMETLTEAPA
jgi:uncharacterized OsmC-like protein